MEIIELKNVIGCKEYLEKNIRLYRNMLVDCGDDENHSLSATIAILEHALDILIGA